MRRMTPEEVRAAYRKTKIRTLVWICAELIWFIVFWLLIRFLPHDPVVQLPVAVVGMIGTGVGLAGLLYASRCPVCGRVPSPRWMGLFCPHCGVNWHTGEMKK